MTAEPIPALARDRLGIARLRPAQLRAVEAVVGGRDVLAVLPTGAGKSAIYELAGLLRAGPTIVVSPLIALQNDQRAHLDAAGLSAVVVNCPASARARTTALAAARRPDAFVFVSPEQLANDEVGAALRARPAGPVRRRRGPPRQPVGPGLPARLPAAGRAGRCARGAGPPRADRDRRATRARGDRAAARAARRGGGDRRLRPPEHRAVGASRSHRRGQAPRPRGVGRRACGPGHRLRGHARERRVGPRRPRRRRAAGDAVPRRAPARRPPASDGGVPRRRGPDHRRHGRVRDGDRQARRALGRARRRAELAGRLLPGVRARRPRRRGGARAARCTGRRTWPWPAA